jgi:hypothetical protein
MKHRQDERYRLHVVAYVLDHFQHLMTAEEKAADAAVVFYVDDGDGESLSLEIGLEGGLEDTVAHGATEALQSGPQDFRYRTAQRIIAEHRDEVYANACHSCRRLPATPTARVCIWCGHSWMNMADA